MDQAEKNQHCTSITDIFGTATSFKLIIDLSMLRGTFNDDAIIHPLNTSNSTQVIVRRFFDTSAMSLNNTNDAPFVKFVGLVDDVAVFSSNKQEPIGKIVRRKGVEIADDEADIFCFPTNTKFTLKNVEQSDDDSPSSMKIFDSNGTVLGTASVTKWLKTGYGSGITVIQELSFHISDGIPEPIKTLLVVAFMNWGRWSKLEVNGRECRCTAVIVFLIIFIIGLSLLVYFAIH